MDGCILPVSESENGGDTSQNHACYFWCGRPLTWYVTDTYSRVSSIWQWCTFCLLCLSNRRGISFIFDAQKSMKLQSHDISVRIWAAGRHALVAVFIVTLRPHRPYRLLGTESSGRPPLPLHSSWALALQLIDWINVALRPQKPWDLLGTGEPMTATLAFTQLLSSQAALQLLCCLMSSDVGWHIIRDKLRPTREHDSVLLYVHRNHKAR